MRVGGDEIDVGILRVFSSLDWHEKGHPIFQVRFSNVWMFETIASRCSPVTNVDERISEANGLDILPNLKLLYEASLVRNTIEDEAS